MVFFLEVVDGTLAGSRYKIDAGVTIGRSRGEIVIEDPKISSAHATFALDNKGQFVLNDLNSANGILSSNRRVRKLAMMPGVVFRLGSTTFKVVQVDDEILAEDFARVKSWRENLAEKLTVNLVMNKPPVFPVQAFSPTLVLTFVEGIQAGEKIKLGYGPRTVGSHSLDIDLLDPQAPEAAFQLIPGPALAKLRNLCDQKLMLNEKPAALENLQDGDSIRVGETLIKVSYA